MLSLHKQHDPRTNAALISQLSEMKQPIQDAVRETERLFQAYGKPKHTSPSLFQRLSSFLFSKKKGDTVTYADDYPYPRWKEQLDAEFSKLSSLREVRVEDYGAIGDGITDNTEAFRKAIGSGRVKVFVPEGVFVTKEIRLPSYTYLIGKGKGVTTIRLHNEAPKDTRLITNKHYIRGNHHIAVEGMSLDWNVERLASDEKTASGGNRSSCLTYANVIFGWVKDVKAINPGLHGFDVSSPRYSYAGDGTRARGGSKYVWLDGLTGHGFGDDGITTHHSDYVLITNSHMCDPSGRAHRTGFSNSNGIEVDDGSRHIWLINNSTARCFGGVEIKAHHNSSAACNVHIIGHISLHDNRSYNFRHIGHHKSTDPESKTAYNIQATNIIAIAPVYTDLYKDSTPRGMAVSAYRNVVINGFTLIGDRDCDYRGNPVIAIQYRARHVVLTNISIRNFPHASADIKVFGGDNRAADVHLQNISIRNSAPNAIHIGLDTHVSIQNVRARGINGKCGLQSDCGLQHITDFYAEGYEAPVCMEDQL